MPRLLPPTLLLALSLALSPAAPASADGLVLIGNESSADLRRGENVPGWDRLPPAELPAGEVVQGRLEFEPRTLRVASVTYSDPASGLGCRLQIRTEPGLAGCEVRATALPRGGEGASCSARVLEEDSLTCGFTAVLGINGF